MDVNIILFDDFETLDAFGPVEILGRIESYTLRYFSLQGGIVTSRQGLRVETMPLMKAASDGIVLLPGGQGTRVLVNEVSFLSAVTNMAKHAAYCLTVCTGSAILAKTGLLDRRKATSNKNAFDWVKEINQKVNWQMHARWSVDGKYYTSSGVSAGMDMALGFISDRFGREKASAVAVSIEYVWNDDQSNDLFAKTGK
ncbi:MAG: DJ-1/PfpI family protein [Selenomonadaceae bacterium]